jgi:hypothetical protein
MLWVQGGPPSAPTASDCLAAVEKSKLSREQKIDGRIKVYREISARFHKQMMNATAKKSFDDFPALLACWKEHLIASLKDIETNINRKKKSGALKDFEIHLRKSIIDANSARLKASYHQTADFDAWLTEANMVHTRFVDLLFQR